MGCFGDIGMNQNQLTERGYWLLLAITSSLMRVPRPGRRATSLLIGLGCMLILIDGIAHPGETGGLWTMSLARQAAELISN
jgi:hypothetical protein